MPVIVATQHNDNQRTGANLQETALRVDNVNVGQFGKLLEFPVDGQVYGQPLYVPNAIGARNVVYVATMHNSVYAFDADEPPGPPAPPPPLWSRNLGPSVPLPDSAIGGGAGYRDLQTEIGILSTPVVSLPHNAIYAVAFTKETDGFHYRLHALDLQTGRELFGGPRTIEASADGSGAGSVNGRILFQSHQQNQRPALLLSNGAIYVCFASFGDHGDYHGWVLGYDAGTLAPLPDAANLTAQLPGRRNLASGPRPGR